VTFERLLDPDDTAWRALMNVYAASFDEAQRETEAGFLSNLTTPRTPRDGGHVVLPAIDCGYASYVFVTRGSRRHGIGTRLLVEMRRHLHDEAAQRHRPAPLGVFTEIQRERQVDAGRPGMLRFWARNGVRPLAVDWEYPPLHDGEPAVPTCLAFGAYGEPATPWYPRDLERVATAIFEATYGYLPRASATLRSIVDGLRRVPPDRPVDHVNPG
jgi:GNAT superfamily N-acetyltransferase